jgi:hypothetical protein
VGTAWIVFLGLGTVLLAVVLFFALMRNRKHNSPAEIARSEQGTRELYAQEDVGDHARDDRVER